MQVQEREIAASEQSSRKGFIRFLNSHMVDAVFVLFLVFLAEEFYSTISAYQAPMWDAAAYMANARGWLTNTPLFEIYRPPLISWLTAGVWAVVGEDWQNVKYLSAFLGIGSASILYLTLRGEKGALFSLGTTVLTMMSPQVFFYGTQLYTETLSLFFLLATLYFTKSQRPAFWFLGGITGALTFASRYPIVFQAAVIVIVESYARKNWQILSRAIAGAVPIVCAVALLMYLKTGTFQTALAKDTSFTLLLTPYYLLNSIATWGWIFLLVPVTLILRRTYTNRYNWVFIAWFVFAILFWSANSTNFDVRYTIQFTPAVNFLALSAVGTFVGINEPLRTFVNSEMPFSKRVSRIASKIPALSAKACTSCGRQVRTNDRYCDRCGRQMKDSSDIALQVDRRLDHSEGVESDALSTHNGAFEAGSGFS